VGEVIDDFPSHQPGADELLKTHTFFVLERHRDGEARIVGIYRGREGSRMGVRITEGTGERTTVLTLTSLC
jgi:hypothetical protein